MPQNKMSKDVKRETAPYLDLYLSSYVNPDFCSFGGAGVGWNFHSLFSTDSTISKTE